jgi:hypothetical protein
MFIENDGQEIATTDFYVTEYAKRGFYYLSWNAGAARILVPESRYSDITEMRTGKTVVICLGKWPEQGGILTYSVTFDDGTSSPYVIFIDAEKSSDRILPDSETGREVPLFIYTASGIEVQWAAARFARKEFV